MTTAIQHAAPEEIMSWLDGELAAAEALPIAEHIQACAECADIAEQFRGTSRAIAEWTVAKVPESLDTAIQKQLDGIGSRHRRDVPRLKFSRSGAWPIWAVGGGVIAAALLIVAVSHNISTEADRQIAQQSKAPIMATLVPEQNPAPPPASAGPMTSKQTQGFIAGADTDAMQYARSRGTAGMVNGPLTNQTTPNPNAPMIARTVSLTIQVKDVSGSRQALDAILSRYQGYAAELTMNTPEGSARSFSASLRIPAPALSAALADLRNLGRVQNESQSGEEVTQQHADLVARLKNARETEQRLLAILQQRTGKVEEVLQVEEQISNTRGEIERMEAEQKALEHRVDFATVQLQLAEEYKAQLNGPSTSIGTRMHNAIVSGLGNAGSSLLGILLFFEEFGPVLLVWFVVLGTPAWFLWRRFRNAQSRI